uniref:Lysosomal dipeptide transporter MFSD1 n=1 Tax=Arcella intermedia TaxID=1963864 RepID=A0A6B2L6S7_9EUKA
MMNDTGLGGADYVGYLYTFYFMLVPFYCIYSGLVIDSGGFALALSSGLLLTLFGTLTTTMAALHSSYPLMLLGRVMSGGCEAVESTLLAYIAIVCRGSLKWEGFAFALSNAMLNLGNVILFFLVPPLLQYGYLYSLGSTVILSVFAILATFAILGMDRRLDLSKERDPEVKESIQLSAIWQQSTKFWLITYLSASNLGIYFNILSFCVLYEYNAGYSTETSGYIPALCSMISLLSPLAMLIIDRYRIHNIVLFSGAIVNVACFFFLSLELPFPFIFFISMGVVYTTSDPIYLELISNEVHQNFLGTAFSLQTIIHAVLHIMYPAIGGWISVRFGWFGFFLFFFGCSTLNLVVLVVYFLLAKRIIGTKYAVI